MPHRRQVSAIGWSAIYYSHDDGTFLTTPLVCFELICVDPEDEAEYRQDDDSVNVDRSGNRTCPPDWYGSAIKAIGLSFFEPHPSRKPSGDLDVCDTAFNFVGYLPPGEDINEWLKRLRS